MLLDTHNLYTKYRYFMYVLSNERLSFFIKNENELDYDKFFMYFADIEWNLLVIKDPWKNFRRKRSKLIKKFEYKKYEILLRSKFCYDIKILILTFIF